MIFCNYLTLIISLSSMCRRVLSKQDSWCVCLVENSSLLSTFLFGRLLSAMAAIISDLNLTLLNRSNISNDIMKPPYNGDITRNAKISFILNLSIVIISLIGNPLTICVVLRKRFRSTSTGFYILCLAVFDILYTLFWPLETTTKVRGVIVSVYLHCELNS